MVRSDHFLPEQAQRVTPKDSAAKTDPRLFRVMGRYNQMRQWAERIMKKIDNVFSG
jgi:hypothetical protein